jgi:hypothetical protein
MIGRAGETAAVARFVERVPDGPVGLVIEGEPGIGKTTVWFEVVRAARARVDADLVAALPGQSHALRGEPLAWVVDPVDRAGEMDEGCDCRRWAVRCPGEVHLGNQSPAEVFVQDR